MPLCWNLQTLMTVKFPIYLARISRGHHVDTLLVPREYKDTFESTELYKVLLPNISIGDVQFAKIYYYD